MIIVFNNKKTVLITTVGLALFGSLFALFKLYYSKKSKNGDSSRNKNSLKSRSNGKGGHTSSNGSVVGGSTKRLERPNTLKYETKPIGASKSFKSTGSLSKKDRSVLNSAQNADVKNLPAEELLELGLNYLNQAIKSWETALDSIETAAYMQSQTLALPNDEHADIVYRLRNLVDKANDINSNCNKKLVKSSQTLQIIQSRLALKQQFYTDVLLKNNNKTEPIDINGEKDQNLVKSESGSYRTVYSPLDSYAKKFGSYFSDDDNDSFVSADSDVDWLNEEMLRNIEYTDEKNVLYEMGHSNATLGRVSYRVSRCNLLGCKSENDFAAKLHVIRLGFDRLLQNSSKKQWMIEEGRELLANFLKKCDKDYNGFYKTYDELIRFVSTEDNWKNIKDELATRNVNIVNFYDIVLDFILLDAFEDLENPPSAITAVIQNTWLSQSFKETALSTAVWSVLKAKRKLLKYPDGFITRFYSITEYLVPVLCWGFLGTDEELNKSCNFLKNNIVEFLKCLFDTNRTRYTNLDDLAFDIETHTTKYLKEINDNI